MIITRQMKASDLFGVFALMNTNLDGNFSLETIEYFVTMWPEGQFVAEDIFGNLIGTLTGTRMSNGRASIALFAVDAKHRHQGVGSRLLDDFRLKCFMQGYTEIQLELRTTNVNALEFYKKHGFRLLENVPDLYGPGEDGLRMVAVSRASS